MGKLIVLTMAAVGLLAIVGVAAAGRGGGTTTDLSAHSLDITDVPNADDPGLCGERSTNR